MKIYPQAMPVHSAAPVRLLRDEAAHIKIDLAFEERKNRLSRFAQWKADA